MAALGWLLNLGFAASGVAALPTPAPSGRLNRGRGGVGRLDSKRQPTVSELRAWLDALFAYPVEPAPQAKPAKRAKRKKAAQSQSAADVISREEIARALNDDALLEGLERLYQSMLAAVASHRDMLAAEDAEREARKRMVEWVRRRRDDDDALKWILEAIA